MKKHFLLLARHTGRRRPRGHDGQVATIRSNVRRCADVLEFTCWSGKVVRVAFALDCHDREVIGWNVTTAGISGEMIRDCVERRFGVLSAPHRVQWLSEQRLNLGRLQDDRAQSRTMLHPGRKPGE
jgi:putative transposase